MSLPLVCGGAVFDRQTARAVDRDQPAVEHGARQLKGIGAGGQQYILPCRVQLRLRLELGSGERSLQVGVELIARASENRIRLRLRRRDILYFAAFKNELFLYPFLVFFLFTNGDVDNWNNILRCALATSIWLYSLRYIQERNFLKYYLFCAFAISFHLSAVILLFIYPVFVRQKDFFKSIPLQLVLLLAVLVVQNKFWPLFGNLDRLIEQLSILTSGAYDYYTAERVEDAVASRSGTGIAYIWILLVHIFIVVSSNRLKRFYHSDRFKMIYSLYFLGLLLFYVFPGGSLILTRPFRYFFSLRTVMLAYFAYYLMRTKHIYKYNKIWLLVLIVSFIGLYSLNIMTSNPEAHQWYQFFFQHPEVPLFPQVK